MPTAQTLSVSTRTLLLAIASAAVSACDANPVESRAQIADGLKVEYSVIAHTAAAARPLEKPDAAAHGQVSAPRHAGTSKNLYHVTLAAWDAKSDAPISDAQVMLNIKGHGYPGHGSMPLQPFRLADRTMYGGYLSLPQPGRYRLTFHVARPDRKYDPVKTVFSYERP